MSISGYTSSIKSTQSVGSEAGPGGQEMFPALAHQYTRELSIPSALVVTDNDSIRQTLAEILAVCAVAPVFANSIGQATNHVSARDFSFVVCQDTLPDGSYSGLMGVKTPAGSSIPLIVISRTGDWPEFLEALDHGAYDFLGYPLIPGELSRIIRHLLDEPRV